MTRQSKYATVKTVFGKFIFTSLLLATASVTQAQAVAGTDSTAQKAHVSYLGLQDQESLFKIQFNNPAEEKYMVSIEDSNRDVLYKLFYSDKEFDKVFKIPKDFDNKINIVIKKLDSNSIQTFEVTTLSSVQEDVVVKKMD